MNSAAHSPLGTRTQAVGLIVWLVVTLAAAGLGNWATMLSVGDWYHQLARPDWTPPDWIFGPVWAALYAMMAVAAWLVWRQARSSNSALVLYVLQLALNVIWSVLFFGLRSPALAAVEIVVLWLVILATLSAFWRRSPAAGLLMVPYAAWVAFAALLNFEFVRLNG
jgi:tryptophan-rich sensory protein